MKRLLAIAIVCVSLHLGGVSRGNPFRSSYVCAPAVNPKESMLEFRIRESSACRENETLLKVYSQKDGTILLYPAPPPASQEDEEALKRYKDFYGITQ